MKAVGWLYFIVVQLVAAILMIAGWVLLLPWAAMELWKPARSVHWPDRSVTVWRAGWLDKVYGNDEDGCTGPSWYLPAASTWWRAYMWSAWRNSTNNLRWVFLWKGGPWFQIRRWGWYAQAGWRPSDGWPVLSAGAGNGSPE